MIRFAIVFDASRLVFALVALAGFANPARASMLIGASLEVDFAKPADAAAKATWSDNLSLDDQGLGWDASPTEHRPGWFQTRPLAAGVWWRPLPGLGVSVEITPPPAPITLDNGQTHAPWPGSVFARYSADKQHWSGWQALAYQRPPATDAPPALANGVTAPPSDAPSLRFTGTLEVTQRNREAYLRHLETYSRLDVPWRSDEDALARWIVAQEPDFFARHIPFVGYVEVLFENGFSGGRRISGVEVHVGGGISGMAAVPRDPAMEKAWREDNSAWRFPDPPAPRPEEALK